MKNCFVFREYLYEITKCLKPKQAKELIYAIMIYEFEGIEPEFKGILNTCFKSYLFNSKQKNIGNGPEHWNYKGGISNENQLQRASNEYLRWRREVFSRDKFTCQICNKQSSELEAHHIKSFSKHKELRFNVENGITLCKKCHRNLHKGVKSDG